MYLKLYKEKCDRLRGDDLRGLFWLSRFFTEEGGSGLPEGAIGDIMETDEAEREGERNEGRRDKKS